MSFSFKYFIYRKFIDPLLSGLHREVINSTKPSEKVIDIACGPGSLSVLLAGKAGKVTGIDIDEEMIIEARKTLQRKGLSNVIFKNMDASDLSCFKDFEFDLAVTSMAVHQFEEELAIQILKEMKRIARRIVVADYNNPMSDGISKWFAWKIEWLAGGDHYRNFKVYMKHGGLNYFFNKAGLVPGKAMIRGNGIFVVLTAKAPRD